MDLDTSCIKFNPHVAEKNILFFFNREVRFIVSKYKMKMKHCFFPLYGKFSLMFLSLLKPTTPPIRYGNAESTHDVVIHYTFHQ